MDFEFPVYLCFMFSVSSVVQLYSFCCNLKKDKGRIHVCTKYFNNFVALQLCSIFDKVMLKVPNENSTI